MLDGATEPICFESRLAKLEVKDDEGDAAKVALLRRWAALEKSVGAPPRIHKVAADIVAHFESRLAAMGGKATDTVLRQAESLSADWVGE